MAREGEYGLYRSFNISKEQELLWIQEYEKHLFMEIEKEGFVDRNFFRLCDVICEYKDITNLKELNMLIRRKKNSMDSFGLMLFAEGLLDIVESFLQSNIRDHKITFLTTEFALDILDDILKNPITIVPYYKRPEYLIDPIDEERLIARVKKA